MMQDPLDELGEALDAAVPSHMREITRKATAMAARRRRLEAIDLLREERRARTQRVVRVLDWWTPPPA